MTRKLVWVRRYATIHTVSAQGQPLPYFISYGPLMDFTGPVVLQGGPLSFYCDVCINIMYVSYSQPDGGFSS
jgi:hypothetical protein